MVSSHPPSYYHIDRLGALSSPVVVCGDIFWFSYNLPNWFLEIVSNRNGTLCNRYTHAYAIRPLLEYYSCLWLLSDPFVLGKVLGIQY